MPDDKLMSCLRCMNIKHLMVIVLGRRFVLVAASKLCFNQEILGQAYCVVATLHSGCSQFSESLCCLPNEDLWYILYLKVLDTKLSGSFLFALSFFQSCLQANGYAIARMAYAYDQIMDLQLCSQGLLFQILRSIT